MFKKIIFAIILIVIPVTDIAAQSIVNPRAMAEFEELDGVLISWREKYFMELQQKKSQNLTDNFLYDGLFEPLVELVKKCLDSGIHVYVLDDISSIGKPGQYPIDYSVLDTLAHWNVTSDKLHAIFYDSQDYAATVWIRDWGPYNIYENGYETLTMAGRGFNSIIADHLNVPFIDCGSGSGSFLHGGNYVTDGFGTLFFDNLGDSWDMPPSAIFGFTNQVEVTSHRVHIDYYMKLVNEETVFVSSIPYDNYNFAYDSENDASDSLKLEEVVSVLKTMTAPTGRPYKIVRIQNAPTFFHNNEQMFYLTKYASYTNSLIINKTVLIPLLEQSSYDVQAQQIYQEHMPGYTILPVNMRYYASQWGMVHCITKEIGASDPVYITHAWYPDSVNQESDYTIEAQIKTQSGVANASVIWSIDNLENTNRVSMTSIGNHRYTADIPGQSYGTRIHYYIEASSTSGKTKQKPMVAPDWAYNFLVDAAGDIVNSVEDEVLAAKPKRYDLSPNYPNPFNAMTSFSFTVPKTELVRIRIYSVTGQLVAELLNSTIEKGTQRLSWDGTTGTGGQASSGVYLLRMETGSISLSRKLCLIK